tara:strand:+ start:114 stop:797 length:684 start_codon:yes stop_codon:yes gene_type:complete
MIKIKNQTLNWKEQSLRYARNSSDNGMAYKTSFAYNFFKFFHNKKIKNILDVGCGNGDFLKNLLNDKNIKKYGIETSQDTVKLCKKRHKKISFKKAFCHNIPFKQNQFDLVVIWSVLHWIDRNYYLQSLGELIRVTNKYLVVMDFFPKLEHKRKYIYKKNFFTYKADFDKIFLSSGLLKKKLELNYYIDEKTNKFVNTYNKIINNSHQRKLVIYEKKDTLPLKNYKI